MATCFGPDADYKKKKASQLCQPEQDNVRNLYYRIPVGDGEATFD
jgi:hypothetical protein